MEMNQSSMPRYGTSSQLVIKNPPNMALGCFIGVMILLVVIIVLLGICDYRTANIVNNTNQQVNAIAQLREVLIAKKLISHIR